MISNAAVALACVGYTATIVIAVAAVYIAVKVRHYTRKYY